MVTRDEKQRLLHDFFREPLWSLGVVLKCATGLLFLAGIAVFGTNCRTLSGEKTCKRSCL